MLIDRLGRVRWHDHIENLGDATIEILLTEDPNAPDAQRAEPAQKPRGPK